MLFVVDLLQRVLSSTCYCMFYLRLVVAGNCIADVLLLRSFLVDSSDDKIRSNKVIRLNLVSQYATNLES